MNRALLIFALLAIVPSVWRLVRPPPAPMHVSVEPLLAGGKMDLNRADRATLELVPGIGPALARRIIEGRPYSRLEDVERVRGIGPAKLRVLSEWATLPPRAPTSRSGHPIEKR